MRLSLMLFLNRVGGRDRTTPVTVIDSSAVLSAAVCLFTNAIDITLHPYIYLKLIFCQKMIEKGSLFSIASGLCAAGGSVFGKLVSTEDGSTIVRVVF